MKETRRLDILAAIGGVLAIAAIVIAFNFSIAGMGTSTDEQYTKARNSILNRMPDNDLRADCELLTAQNRFSYPEVYAKREEITRRAADRFPNSARVQLHAGVLLKGPASVKSLKRAAELYKSNSLPLYLLASEAASRNAWDEVNHLMKAAGERKKYTEYPIQYESIPAAGPVERLGVLCEFISPFTPVSSQLRTLARSVGNHSLELHESGKSQEALALLAETKQIGWSMMSGEPGRFMNVIVGNSIISISHRYEKQILQQTGSTVELNTIKGEVDRLHYLMAGFRLHTDTFMQELVRNMMQFFSPTVSVVPISLQVWLMVFALISFAWLAFASRGKPASELHPSVTEQTFKLGRLIRLYAIVFLPIGIAASFVFYFSGSEALEYETPILLVAAIVPCVILYWRTASWYKKAFRKAAEEAGQEVPRLWKGVPKADKREVARRLAGVHGGAVVFLVVWGLLISAGMKVYFGAFPWQIEHMLFEPLQREQQYVDDLLSNKIKVPEKYIRAEEEKEKKAEKRREMKIPPSGG